jgi:hypothetical protein
MVANITALLSTLITANHILSYHDVLDPFGHVSVRNPNTNTTFFIALQLGMSLLSSSSVTAFGPTIYPRTPFALK